MPEIQAQFYCAIIVIANFITYIQDHWTQTVNHRMACTMRKYILILALALFCASAFAITGVNNNVSAGISGSDIQSNETKQINESAVHFALVNLIKLDQDKPIDPKKGFNVTQVALGKNASINLVRAAPGSILKTHYHKYRDEVAYVTAGQAIFTVSGENYTVKAGDLMYIPAMTLHRVVAIGNENVQVVSTFTPPFDGKDRIYIEN